MVSVVQSLNDEWWKTDLKFVPCSLGLFNGFLDAVSFFAHSSKVVVEPFDLAFLFFFFSFTRFEGLGGLFYLVL